MFFKAAVFALLCLPAPAFGFLGDFSCFREIKAYYPKIFDGTLPRRQQKRFFRCIHDALELVVEEKVFGHDASRDHFTKGEIYKLFHEYFKFPPAQARRFVERLFIAKKILVGGKIDQLADRELGLIYRLTYDYEKAYKAFQKAIPVFRGLFFGQPAVRLDPRRLEWLLKKTERALEVLRKAYQREGAVYSLSGLDQMHLHLHKAGLTNERGRQVWRGYSRFFHLWAHGLFPEAEIRAAGWPGFFRSFHLLLSQFAWYKNYIQGESPFHPRVLPASLTSLRLLTASLMASDQPERGFPLKNLDEMLFLMMSAAKGPEQPQRRAGAALSLFGAIEKHEGRPLSLLSRTLACFSLPPLPPSDLCGAKWGSDSSGSVTMVFPDGEYTLYEDRQEWILKPEKPFDISRRQLEHLDRWMAGYIEGLESVQSGQIQALAQSRLFDQWLDPFFGETPDGRISFGSFELPQGPKASMAWRLLNYQALLQLFLSSYGGDQAAGLFSPAGGEAPPPGLAPAAWRQIVNEISPSLASLQKDGYQYSWRAQFNSLFEYADYFLNSSDRNGALSGRELADLAAHFLAAMKNSSLAFDRLSALCGEAPATACAIQNLLSDEAVLLPFPLLKSYLSVYGAEKHQAGAEALFSEKPLQEPSDLMAFFLLSQMLEMNFHFFDADQSRYLEEGEVELLVRGFEEKTAAAVPYIYNSSQARSFLIYSFKTGMIPFLKEGDEAFLPVHFLNWHLRPESRENFRILRGDVYSIGMDFYSLYQKALP